MNGKMAKMLRRIGREDSKSKAAFNALNADTKGVLRNNVDNYKQVIEARLEAASVSTNEINEKEVDNKDYSNDI